MGGGERGSEEVGDGEMRRRELYMMNEMYVYD